jgi:hypothetical protein
MRDEKSVSVASTSALGNWRPTAPDDDSVELPRNPPARQRGIAHQAQAFAGEIVDHGQDPEPPPIA